MHDSPTTSRLTAMVKHNNYAMSGFDHVIQTRRGMIMARLWHGHDRTQLDHGIMIIVSITT